MKIDYNLATPSWHDSHLYGPAPRWRRRILLNMIKKLNVSSCLDIGCAQPFLLLGIRQLGIRLAGCDISVPVIEENAKAYPDIDFFILDLCDPADTCRVGGGYDIVTCSEVLEHLEEYEAAIENICKLSRKYVLITVPSGKVYPIDSGVGHIRHYTSEMLKGPLERNGFEIVKTLRRGFPFHSLYKRLINLGGGSGISEKYSSARYGKVQKIVATLVYALFYLNVFPLGNQLIVLAEKFEK